MEKTLWEPSLGDLQSAQLTKYQAYLKASLGIQFKDYLELHQWSVDQKEQFWSSLFGFFDLAYEGELEPAWEGDFLHYGWFKKVRLNFAENLLRPHAEEEIALNFVHESGFREKISYQVLRNQAASFAQYLKQKGFEKGDVLAAYMPNSPETVVAMLGVASLGGVFTSTSSDFGIEGVVDRFGQSKPKILVAAVAYTYGGKQFDQTEKIKEIKQRVPSIEKVVLVDFLVSGIELTDAYCDRWEKTVEQYYDGPQVYERVRFDDPLYIMYSSGTTGKPKCIVHSVGGTLLQHVKELGLHTNLTMGKKIFYFTTCGWMMWNWLVSSLFCGAEVVLYEGSPAHPSLDSFMGIIDREKINIFGTSPKFLRALESQNVSLEHSFSSLECVLSTGAPLLPEQFDYVYEKIKKGIRLSSICGGTDIIGCFMLGNPLLPVRRGEIQCLGLGMDVSSFNENGKEVLDREGELVCKSPFPSQPICFLNDDDQSKIKDAYFNHFEGIWRHGDFITLTDRKTVVVYGRSDATLNPGGVRIGTAEIYRQTELLPYIEDSICVGLQRDGDVDVILFVQLASNESLDEQKITEIKKTIRSNTTPRHVPKEVYQVKSIPYTRSGKKMEMAVTKLIAGKQLNNIEAVANPESLEEFKKLT